MGFGGLALKTTSIVLRVVEFAAAIVILGIFSYFLVYLQHNDLPVLQWVRAVEGISGVAALYTLIAFFLACFLGGLTFFAFLGIVLDIAFVGCFIAVAVLTKGGLTDCGALTAGSSGLYNDTDTVVSVDADQAQRICHLYKATFAISIIELILFLISALFSFLMGRHHQHEKRQGTVGSSKPKFPRFGRKRNVQHEMEQGTVPTH